MVTKRPTPAPQRPDKQEGKFTDFDLDQARVDIKRAFELCGLADKGGNPVCPQCGKTGKSRIKFFQDGGYKCYSAEWCSGRKAGAVDLVMERLGVSFPEAVGLLLGRPVSSKARNAKPLPVPVVIESEANDFKAVVDSTVYEAIASHGSVDAAARYYARFGIDAEAVRESGAFMVEDIQTMQRELLAAFGRERLVVCGVVIPGEDGKDDFWVISERYPVGEPHRHPNGQILGLQFRPSLEQEKRYKAHKAYSAEKQAAQANGETFREPKFEERYVPKFMSLKGGTGSDHLVGCGLPRLNEIRSLPDQTVYIVEGFKDMLAMRTLGFEAYALPGAGTVPPKDAVRLLAAFNLALAFDADEGGDAGGARLEAALAKHGIVSDAVELAADAHTWAPNTKQFRLERSLRLWRKRPPQGMDIADVLRDHVKTKVVSGCTCRACRFARTQKH
jgi:hypothetical protein